MAVLATSGSPIPDTDFPIEWKEKIDTPFLTSIALTWFDKALSACIQISRGMSFKNVNKFKDEEDELLADLVATYELNLGYLRDLSKDNLYEHIDLGLDYLESTWDKIVNEYELFKAGELIREPLHVIQDALFSGDQTESFLNLASIRILFVQGECHRLSS